MDPKEYKDQMDLIKTIMQAATSTGLRWDTNISYAGDEETSAEEQLDFDIWKKDREKYLREVRLVEQRKKELNKLKSKLSYRAKKLDQLIMELKTLIERYGHLETSADLLAKALLGFEDGDE